MPSTSSWADEYLNKKRSLSNAIGIIRPGQRVFIGSACGEPQALVRELSDASRRLTGIEIVRLMSRETISLTSIANQTKDLHLNVRTIYLGSATSPELAGNIRFMTPMNLSEVPPLFRSRKLPIDIALVQVSHPDDFGWMSLGVSVDVTMAAALSADLVIAQVNPNMPRVLGRSFLHVNDVDIIVEEDEALLTVEPGLKSEAANVIGKHISKLVVDGATLQIGLDSASQATVQALSDKNDLGIHSQFITDDIMHLYAMGVISNRKKGFNDGKLVASSAVGSNNLYEFINDNPAVDFYPSDYVNDPFIISQHNRMVSLNVASIMDLTGQASAEAVEKTRFAGVSGIPDFVRGAKRSKEGKSILMLFSTSEDGKKSNIVPRMDNTAVVVPRGDVHYVVSEYGAVNLFGKSLQERAMAMISIAHPDFREALFDYAKEGKLIDSDKTSGDAILGIYPVNLETTIHIKGEEITIRPAKFVDERRIQEHYYGLEKKDVYSRFFQAKTKFAPWEAACKSQIDYKKSMTLVSVVGEFGFGRIIGVSEYFLLEDRNIAEISISISKEYQGLGLGKILLRKLAESASYNGISGFVAYTSKRNKAMIRLFGSLPYRVTKSFDDKQVYLACRFDEPVQNG